MVRGEKPPVTADRTGRATVPEAEYGAIAASEREEIDGIIGLAPAANDPRLAAVRAMGEHPPDVLAPCLDDGPIGAFAIMAHPA